MKWLTFVSFAAVAVTLAGCADDGRTPFAYLTLLCTDSMLEPVLVLGRSIRQTATAHPYIVLVLPDVSSAARSQLQHVALLHEIQPLKYPFEVTEMRRQMNKPCRYSKLQLWNLTEYKKVIFLDADMLVLRNIDELFAQPQLSACADMNGNFNSGIFVAEPSAATLHSMLSTYLQAPSYNVGDQGFLNWYFNGSWTVLPPKYNVLIKYQEYTGWDSLSQSAAVVHYTSETKPWTFYNWPHKHWQRNYNPALFYKWSQLSFQHSRAVCDNHEDKIRAPHKFSVLLGTWDRLQLLLTAINHYSKSSFVDAVYITWHNPSAPVPKELEALAARSRKIKILKQHTNSLNNRFKPIKGLRTPAVYVSDDDILVDLKDLHLAFRVWQQRPESLVGFFPRAHIFVNNTYEYLVGAHQSGAGYSIMLTKGMFMSSQFLFAYYCLLPDSILEYVDSISNCEDIAMNIMASGITGKAPVYVATVPKDYGTTSGISSKLGHVTGRSTCVDKLTILFGRNNLVYNTEEVRHFTKARVTKQLVEVKQSSKLHHSVPAITHNSSLP